MKILIAQPSPDDHDETVEPKPIMTNHNGRYSNNLTNRNHFQLIFLIIFFNIRFVLIDPSLTLNFHP